MWFSCGLLAVFPFHYVIVDLMATLAMKTHSSGWLASSSFALHEIFKKLIGNSEYSKSDDFKELSVPAPILSFL